MFYDLSQISNVKLLQFDDDFVCVAKICNVRVCSIYGKVNIYITENLTHSSPLVEVVILQLVFLRIDLFLRKFSALVESAPKYVCLPAVRNPFYLIHNRKNFNSSFLQRV